MRDTADSRALVSSTSRLSRSWRSVISMLGRIVDDSSSFTSRSMRPTSVFNSDSKHAVPDTETRRRLVRESFTRPASDAHAFTVKFTHAFAQTRAFTRHLRATRTVVGNRTANNSHAHHARSHYIAPRRVRPCNARNDVVRMHMTHCQCMRSNVCDDSTVLSATSNAPVVIPFWRRKERGVGW